MARRIKIDVMPARQADKLTCVASSAVGVVDPCLPVECILVIGDDVDLHRMVEIENGFRWLWNSLRDKGLLQPQFSDPSYGPLYSVAPIDNLTEPGRLISWDDISGVTPDMIGVGVGIDVFALRGTQMVESAFTKLREFYREYRGDYPV